MRSESKQHLRLFDRPSTAQGGFALVLTLLVLVLIALTVSGMVQASLSLIRTAVADQRSTETFYIAEAGAEAALSEVELALNDGLLEDGELASISPPDLSPHVFDSFGVTKEGSPVTEPITDGAYAGLLAITQNLAINSAVTDPSGTHVAIRLGAKAMAIPIFQFAAFFEGDFEDYAGSRKDMWGRVHGNGDMFLSGADLHFHEQLTTPNRVHRDHKISHDDPNNAGVWIDDESGTEVRLTFDTDDTPDPEQFKSKSIADFDGRLKSGAFGVETLRLPLPDGMDPHEVIRPREGDDTESEKATKFAWKADMYIVVDLDNIVNKWNTCGGSDNTKHPTITITRPADKAIPPDDKKCEMFDWAFEEFYEQSELLWVDVLNVDMNKLGDWAEDAPENATEIIYVEFRPPSACMPNPGDTNPNDGACGPAWPALRMRDAAKLPGPLTLGSEYPLYVWGDYNTDTWQPSALFGDRLAALSNNWDDDDSTSEKPPASNTSQYFAVVTGTGEGYIGCYHEDASCSPPDAGGTGWVKLLENWKSCSGQPEGGRCYHTMIGSFVSLWAPKVASAIGNDPRPGWEYYVRPIRDWSFDSRFENPALLPPGTPVVGQVFRAAFREAY